MEANFLLDPESLHKAKKQSIDKWKEAAENNVMMTMSKMIETVPFNHQNRKSKVF